MMAVTVQETGRPAVVEPMAQSYALERVLLQ
jgi:hypothetical protein